MYLNAPETDLAIAADAIAPPKAAAPRMDLYSSIHKSMRLFMFDTTCRVGHMDVTDEDEFKRALDQANALLDECESHVQRENDFVHPALEARVAGSSRVIMEEHFDHLDSIDLLRTEVLTLRSSAAEKRPSLAHKLYLHLTQFVAENLIHMQVEETTHNPVLWAKFSDTELGAIHQRILASVGPTEMAELMQWMVPALTHQERAGMFGDMQASPMPREAFAGMLDIARSTLTTANWDKLARALNVPQVPSLVDFC